MYPKYENFFLMEGRDRFGEQSECGGIKKPRTKIAGGTF